MTEAKKSGIGELVLFGDGLYTIVTVRANGVLTLKDESENTVEAHIDEIRELNPELEIELPKPEIVGAEAEDEAPFAEEEEPAVEDDNEPAVLNEPVVEDNEPAVEPNTDLARRVERLERVVRELIKRLQEADVLPEPPKPEKGMKVKALFDGQWLDATIVGRSRKSGKWVVEDHEGTWEVSENEMKIPVQPKKKTRTRTNKKQEQTEQKSPAQKRLDIIEDLGLEEGDTVVVKRNGKTVKGKVTKIYKSASKFKGYVKIETPRGKAVMVDPLEDKITVVTK